MTTRGRTPIGLVGSRDVNEDTGGRELKLDNMVAPALVAKVRLTWVQLDRGNFRVGVVHHAELEVLRVPAHDNFSADNDARYLR